MTDSAPAVPLMPFDFDGLDESAVVVHPEHGPCAMSERFIRWAGWTNPAHVRRDHLRPGDEVQIRTSTKRGRGVTERDVRYLTERGIQRLLFRSDHARAVEYTDRVLDMLAVLKRDGMVVDETRITDKQLAAGKQRLDDIAQRRIEERRDYKVILHSLKLGQAVGDDYRHVQNSLYVVLFGHTASTIRSTREIRTWDGKRGPTVADKKVAKNYLDERELKLLNNTVLATFVQIDQHYPNGASPSQMVNAIQAAAALTLPKRVGEAA